MSLRQARTLRSSSGARWRLPPLAAISATVVLAPAAAHAGQGNSTTPTFPVAAAVGATALDASIEIVNQSTPPQSNGTSRICGYGEAGLCAGDGGITLVPSCGQIDAAILTCSKPDPDVFAVTSTPVGAVGSGCAGTVFDVEVADPALGKLRFTPRGAGISLIPGATCKIDFKVAVQKLPSIDEDPLADGVQTKQLATSRLVASLSPTSGQGTGTSFGTTVTPQPPPQPPPLPPPPPPPATRPPPPTAPASRCVRPPGPAPPGQVVCRAPLAPSSRPSGTARITGRTGCVTRDFDVTVSGRQIRRVAFYLDGKLIRTLTKPNDASRFRIAVRPGTLERGTHRVIAKTTFLPASATRARSLRVVFQRCGRAAIQPQFTG
jgi:hypothetical protein